MADNKFTVADNEDQMFSTDEIKIVFQKDPHVGRVWTMSYDQLVDLQTSIATFLADGRG